MPLNLLSISMDKIFHKMYASMAKMTLYLQVIHKEQLMRKRITGVFKIFWVLLPINLTSIYIQQRNTTYFIITKIEN